MFLCVQSSESPPGRAHANILTLLAGCHNHKRVGGLFRFCAKYFRSSKKIKRKPVVQGLRNDMQPEAEAEAKNIIMIWNGNETVDRAASQPASRAGEMLILF